MDRRAFVVNAAFLCLLKPAKVFSDSHVVSADPYISNIELAGNVSRFTAAQDFYVRNHYRQPAAAQEISIVLSGTVDHPMTLDNEALARLPSSSMGAVMECAGNVVGTRCQASNGAWMGWWLRDVLALAQPQKQSAFLRLTGADGFFRNVPIEQAMADGFLATHLNGKPLLIAHGAPIRCLFRGWYGMDAIKWLRKLELTDTAPEALDPGLYRLRYRGTDGTVDSQPLPKIAVKSIITSPNSLDVLHRGRIGVQGLAWSGSGKIKRVELSMDGGRVWAEANLSSQHDGEWVVWRGEVHVDAGSAIEIVCRATDEPGARQPLERDPRRVDGYANNWCHRVNYVVA